MHHAPAPQLPLFDMPTWAESVGVFDLETTGVDVEHDRIVSAYVGRLGPGGEIVHDRIWLADPGIEIPLEATAIHGISTSHAREHGSPAIRVVADVVAALTALFRANIPVVAYNAAFDFSMLRYEALRHGVTPIEHPSPIIDPLVLDKAFDRYRRGKRTLDVVARHYDVSLTNAHDAAADAVAAGRVAQALATRYRDAMPAASSELHTQQIGWALEQAESLTEYFVKIGRIDANAPLDGRWPVR